MERRTLLGVAGGITLTAATAAAAIGVNLGIMSSDRAEAGIGTFAPSTIAQPATTTSTTSTLPATTTTVVTIYVDEFGNPVDPTKISAPQPPASDDRPVADTPVTDRPIVDPPTPLSSPTPTAVSSNPATPAVDDDDSDDHSDDDSGDQYEVHDDDDD